MNNLIEDIIKFIYYSQFGKEIYETDEYIIGSTITTNKFYVKIKSKLINFEFPKIKYLSVSIVSNKYILEFDYSDPEDEVDSDIINNPNLTREDKLLLLYALRIPEFDNKVPRDLIKRYKQTNTNKIKTNGN